VSSTLADLVVRTSQRKTKSTGLQSGAYLLRGLLRKGKMFWLKEREEKNNVGGGKEIVEEKTKQDPGDKEQ